MKGGEKKLVRRVVDELDDSLQTLDTETRNELSRRRQKAVLRQPGHAAPPLWLGLSGALTALVVMVLLWQRPFAEPEVPAEWQMLELALAEDAEYLDNLDLLMALEVGDDEI